jgi:hypothetical protein
MSRNATMTCGRERQIHGISDHFVSIPSSRTINRSRRSSWMASLTPDWLRSMAPCRSLASSPRWCRGDRECEIERGSERARKKKNDMAVLLVLL